VVVVVVVVVAGTASTRLATKASIRASTSSPSPFTAQPPRLSIPLRGELRLDTRDA
jgi:hypothetical protein